MVLNWGLAGAPYVSCDIGGFTGDTTALLLTRWMQVQPSAAPPGASDSTLTHACQVGVFMPIMRVHSTKSATPHFPWLWGEPYASIMRTALELR